MDGGDLVVRILNDDRGSAASSLGELAEFLLLLQELLQRLRRLGGLSVSGLEPGYLCRRLSLKFSYGVPFGSPIALHHLEYYLFEPEPALARSQMEADPQSAKKSPMAAAAEKLSATSASTVGARVSVPFGYSPSTRALRPQRG